LISHSCVLLAGVGCSAILLCHYDSLYELGA